MKDITFNTGRLYTAEGQVIRAIEQEDGSILFSDFSRGISGQIERPLYDISEHRAFATYVVQEYSKGHYEYCCAAAAIDRDELIDPALWLM